MSQGEPQSIDEAYAELLAGLEAIERKYGEGSLYYKRYQLAIALRDLGTAVAATTPIRQLLKLINWLIK